MEKHLPPEKSGQAPRWHTGTIAEILAQTESGSAGLTAEQASQRLRRFGPNAIPRVRQRSAIKRFLTQFHNILIYVLIIAGSMTLVLRHWIDAGVIFGVIIINAIIGFIQEGKAEQALDAVRRLLSPGATVLRDGKKIFIPAEEIVPGDVIFVQSGDRIAADARLLHIKDLQIDESLLTGESQPVEKGFAPVAAGAAIADRRNMIYSGTFVTTGQASAVVVATGMDTELGRISAMLSGVAPLTTPLLRQLNRFARRLTAAIILLAVFVFTYGALWRHYLHTELFLAAVALAVAAIPEGLPAIITITLAIGVQRMARRHVIIRRLPAVETLGSVTVICSDKTGTLTRNEMTVQTLIPAPGRTISISGSGYEPHGGFVIDNKNIDIFNDDRLAVICRAAMLCNDAGLVNDDGHWKISGDPTEAALLVMATKAGFDHATLVREYPRIDVIPFESEHRFMATLHHDHSGQGFIFVKGAPEAVLPCCANQFGGDGERQTMDMNAWDSAIDELAGGGQRPLAIAVKPVPVSKAVMKFSDIDDLELVAVAGISDPPREEAAQAIRRCRSAGIEIKMITGDHLLTASAVAGQMGLPDADQGVTGAELAGADQNSFLELISGNTVFARTDPEHKLRLVRGLQKQGHIVAVTGDGVNDAPALKQADVGVAMGLKGTEVAKEAAEMVIIDDNFSSIVNAVEEGRTVYDNIRKSILFILPTSIGEALTIIAAIIMGTLLPVTAAQILWINMITTVTLALALSFEPPEANIMGRAPRKGNAPLLDGFMFWRIVFVAVLMLAAAFGLFIYAIRQGASLEEGRTVAVNMLVFAEALYLFNTRYLTASCLNREGLLGNRMVLIAVGVVLLLQLLFTYHPLMQTFFHSRAISLEAWGQIAGLSLLIFILVEIEKVLLRYRKRHSGPD